MLKSNSAMQVTTEAIDVARAVELLNCMIASAERNDSAISTESYKRVVWRNATQVRGLLTGASYFPADRKHAELRGPEA